MKSARKTIYLSSNIAFTIHNSRCNNIKQSLFAICYSLLFYHFYVWIFFLIFRADEFEFLVFSACTLFQCSVCKNSMRIIFEFIRFNASNSVIVYISVRIIIHHNCLASTDSNTFYFHCFFDSFSSVAFFVYFPFSFFFLLLVSQPTQLRNVQNVRKRFQFWDQRKSLITLFTIYHSFAHFFRHILTILF